MTLGGQGSSRISCHFFLERETHRAQEDTMEFGAGSGTRGTVLAGGHYQRSLERVTGSWRASTIGALSPNALAIMMKTQYLCTNFVWQSSPF